jgi:hypothetical protein
MKEAPFAQPEEPGHDTWARSDIVCAVLKAQAALDGLQIIGRSPLHELR